MVKNVNTLLKRPYKVKIGNLTMPIAHQKVSKKGQSHRNGSSTRF